jgi:hypothetical protein
MSKKIFSGTDSSGTLQHIVLQVAKAERRDRVDFIAKYFKESTKTHGGYAINFFLCEVNYNKSN